MAMYLGDMPYLIIVLGKGMTALVTHKIVKKIMGGTVENGCLKILLFDIFSKLLKREISCFPLHPLHKHTYNVYLCMPYRGK